VANFGPSCILIKSLNFVQENVKNCTLISHFALVSGRRRSQNPLPGFAVDLTGGLRSLGPARPPPREPLHCKILGTPMLVSILWGKNPVCVTPRTCDGEQLLWRRLRNIIRSRSLSAAWTAWHRVAPDRRAAAC